MKSNEFDKNLGKIMNIIVSCDMSCSKRRNGRSYDSLNGYSTIISTIIIIFIGKNSVSVLKN